MWQKLDRYEKFKIVFVLLLLIFYSVMFFGCSTKTFYKGIAKHEPKTIRDTAALAIRYSATFPSKKQVIKKGQTVYVKDTAALKKLQKQIDSIKARPKEVITIHDSCGKEANDGYEAGFNLGKQVGHYDGLQDCEGNTFRVDTVYKDFPETIALQYSLKDSLQTAQKQAITEKATIDKQDKKLTNRMITMLSLIILCLILGGLNYLQYKSKIKKLPLC